MRELLVTTKLGILLSTAFFILCSSLSHAAPDADFVFINGKIYTMDEDKAWATALVVSANKISHVGSNDGARKYIGSDTRVIDPVSYTHLTLPTKA